eukprot:Gregarina_sp_Pseudo_9__999@NODE_1642_length_1429_cov_89_689928_g1522_i0_p1_GENE_NODE_1642_length_1429_cov_89_689928_g1522_i0NODE_1642_length_1429_cov_89_689928_g1522_i0_p1_ORF_typecomplete_len406_score57_33Aminotran_1_2/PF00155_21/1_7e42_NODE_1642_length_1429_cov_89_689928_g1522_i01621379
MSLFKGLPPAPVDPIFSISQAYKEDTSDSKVDISVGAYRNNEGKPVVFDCVRKAGTAIYSSDKFDKEYLPMSGDPTFTEQSQMLVFGDSCGRRKEGKIVSVQSLSGTGALTVVGHLLRLGLGTENTIVYVSNPTWPNHIQIYGELLGFQVEKYPYWDQEKKTANISAMLKTLKEAPERSIVILHACAHNPTGEDPSFDEWKQILSVIRERRHVPIMDSAYQGFASDLDDDARAIRLFADSDVEFAVCQSYAKNMGLYGERCGCLHWVSNSKEEATRLKGILARICRSLWSNPPKHGSEIAKMILTDSTLNAQWKKELKAASNRICDMRAALRKAIESNGTPGTWAHLTNQIGMFSYTGLTEPQCNYVTKNYHIYLTKNGRISMAGVTTHNVEYIAKAIDAAVRNS